MSTSGCARTFRAPRSLLSSGVDSVKVRPGTGFRLGSTMRFWKRIDRNDMVRDTTETSLAKPSSRQTSRNASSWSTIPSCRSKSFQRSLIHSTNTCRTLRPGRDLRVPRRGGPQGMGQAHVRFSVFRLGSNPRFHDALDFDAPLVLLEKGAIVCCRIGGQMDMVRAAWSRSDTINGRGPTAPRFHPGPIRATPCADI